MVVPEDISRINYTSLFSFNLVTAVDNSVIAGEHRTYETDQRILAEETTLEFTWEVLEHTTRKIVIWFEFALPEGISNSIYGRDKIEMEFKSLSPFIS